MIEPGGKGARNDHLTRVELEPLREDGAAALREDVEVVGRELAHVAGDETSDQKLAQPIARCGARAEEEPRELSSAKDSAAAERVEDRDVAFGEREALRRRPSVAPLATELARPLHPYRAREVPAGRLGHASEAARGHAARTGSLTRDPWALGIGAGSASKRRARMRGV